MERLGHELQDNDFNNFVDQLISQMNVSCSGGSGWVVGAPRAVVVKSPLPWDNPSHRSFQRLPPWLGSQEVFWKVKTKVTTCFLYCVLAALYLWKKHRERPPYMHLLESLEFKMQDFPSCLGKIRISEKRNKFSITVYRFENENFYNVHHSKSRASRKNVKLLLLVKGTKSHYCLIKNFSNVMHRLHRSSKKRFEGPKSKFCSTCFQPIVRKKKHDYQKQNYQKHLEFCEEHKFLEIQMPETGKTLSLSNCQKTQWCPLVVYADLEATDVKCDEFGASTSNTTEIERQYPASFGAVVLIREPIVLWLRKYCFERLVEIWGDGYTWPTWKNSVSVFNYIQTRTEAIDDSCRYCLFHLSQ